MYYLYENMIPSCSEIQPIREKILDKRVIDYEKNRYNNFDETLPQKDVSTTRLNSSKHTFEIPTYYSLEKKFKEKFSRYSRVNRSSIDNKTKVESVRVKKREKEDRIYFFFRIKPKQNRRNSVAEVPSSCTRITKEKKSRRAKSDSSLYSSRIPGIITVSSSCKPSLIKQILKESKKESKNYSLRYEVNEVEKKLHRHDYILADREVSTLFAAAASAANIPVSVFEQN